MLKKALVSPIALAFGLALTGAAAAQTMVGDQSISETDLPRVQEYCDELLADETVATDQTTDNTSADAEEGADSTADSGDLSFASITLDDCREAGLVD